MKDDLTGTDAGKSILGRPPPGLHLICYSCRVSTDLTEAQIEKLRRKGKLLVHCEACHKSNIVLDPRERWRCEVCGGDQDSGHQRLCPAERARVRAVAAERAARLSKG